MIGSATAAAASESVHALSSTRGVAEQKALHVHSSLQCDAPEHAKYASIREFARVCEVLDFLAYTAGVPLVMHRTAVPIGGLPHDQGPASDFGF